MTTDYNLFSNTFTYNAVTGTLHRKDSPVSIAGKQVRHNGTDYWVNRIIWLLNTGEWPKGNLKYVDGNKKNTRISNLRLASEASSPLVALNIGLTPPTIESSELVSLKTRLAAEEMQINNYTTQLEAKYGPEWEDELAVRSIAASALMGRMMLSRNELVSKIDQLEGRAEPVCNYAGYGHYKFPCIDNECRTVDEWLAFRKSCPYLKLIPDYDKEIEGYKLFDHGLYIPQNIFPLVEEARAADVLSRKTAISPSVQTAKMKLQEEESYRNPNPHEKWLEGQIWASQLEEHRARPADHKKHNPPAPPVVVPPTLEEQLKLQAIEDDINGMLGL